MPRTYSMERRTAVVDETRQRIVEATIELHNEKGILATTMQDIAARAGVALGTVYRHFPSVDELIPACGGRSLELNPPPTSAVFAGIDGGPARVHALFDALYAHYEAMERPYFVARAEAQALPVLQQFVAAAEAHLRALVTEAVAPLHPSEEQLGIAIAMADFYTWYTLFHTGFTTTRAAKLAAGIVLGHPASERGGA